MNAFFACGVAGTELTAEERSVLAEVAPAVVVLFARNLASREQVLALIEDLRSLPSSPLVAVDLEGGRVNRLRNVVGPLPGAATAARAGLEACRALGEAAGAACAHFGIAMDFAPVLDVAWPNGWLAQEGRCWGPDPEGVRAAAGAFLAGLEGYGVRGCLKHYPGLGTGVVDSHRELPHLGEGVALEEEGFAVLAGPRRAVMVAHALAPQLGEAYAPASLSPVVVGRLTGLGCGLILADDLEMGALEGWGSVAERAAAALAAGCDQVILSNLLEARVEVVHHVRRVAAEEELLQLALRRSQVRFAEFCRDLQLRQVGWEEVEEKAEAARRLAGEDP